MTPEPTPSQELREELDEQIEKALSSFERLLVGKYPDYKVPEIAEVARLEAKQDIQALFKQHELSRKQEWVEAQEKYDELIMAVGNKYAGETRHETALRYIKSCETALRYIKSCENSSNTQSKTIKEQSKE